MLFVITFFIFCSCKKDKTDFDSLRPAQIRWDFNDLDGLYHTPGMPENYELQDGVLKIYTRAGSSDRIKFRSNDMAYVHGRYSWRVFVPEMGAGDMSSIGCFLYYDDEHELDFEIGYGKSSVRKELNAGDDDLIAYMTSQANPKHQLKKTVKRNEWHNFAIELQLQNGKYTATWYIDDNAVTSRDLDFGPEEIKFYVFISVENLTFIGDHVSTQDNYGLFDYVEYKYNE